MPYLTADNKQNVGERKLTNLNSGELNYELTMSAIQFLQTRVVNYDNLQAAYHHIEKEARQWAIEFADEASSYDRLLDHLLGAARLAQAEFYRRVLAPYEDKKIKANGDVYPKWLLEKVI